VLRAVFKADNIVTLDGLADGNGGFRLGGDTSVADGTQRGMNLLDEFLHVGDRNGIVRYVGRYDLGCKGKKICVRFVLFAHVFSFIGRQEY
jgi:hypothetical protein